MAGRKPKPKVQASAALLKALDFVGVAVKQSEPAHANVQFRNKHLFASNGILSAGCNIEDELETAPNFAHLQRALKLAKTGFTMTQIDAGRLAVASEKFRAIIPCLALANASPIQPDQNIAPINDAIRHGFQLIGPLVKEAGATVVEASLLLQGGSMVATDRVTMMEFWHGCDMPPEIIVPKTFISAVAATTSPIVGFGFTPRQSFTIWFEDGSWIKTQQFSDPWPDYTRILNHQVEPWPVSPGMFDAIEAVKDFSDDDTIFFSEGVVHSHETRDIGASHECDGVPIGFSFSGSKLAMLRDVAEAVNFNTEHKAMFFFCRDPMIRGIIAMKGRASETQFRDPKADQPVPAQFHPPAPPAAPYTLSDGSAGALQPAALALAGGASESEYRAHGEADIYDDNAGPVPEGWTPPTGFNPPAETGAPSAEHIVNNGWQSTVRKDVPFGG